MGLAGFGLFIIDSNKQMANIYEAAGYRLNTYCRLVGTGILNDRFMSSLFFFFFFHVYSLKPLSSKGEQMSMPKHNCNFDMC